MTLFAAAFTALRKCCEKIQDGATLYKRAVKVWAYSWWWTHCINRDEDGAWYDYMRKAMHEITAESIHSPSILWKKLLFPVHMFGKWRAQEVFDYYNIAIDDDIDTSNKKMLELLSMYQALNFAYSQYPYGGEGYAQKGKDLFEKVYHVWAGMYVLDEYRPAVDELLHKFPWQDEQEIIRILFILTDGKYSLVDPSEPINTVQDIKDIVEEFKCYDKENIHVDSN